MLKKIPRKIKNIKRSREIANVLIKHGFGHLTESIGLKLSGRKRIDVDVVKTPVHVRARLVLEELGTTFIKFGQILSMRPDLIPLEFVEEFRKLQDDVPGFEYESVKAQIEKELEAPLNEIYDSFDRKPLAAASIAQVHDAIINGMDVVVKVQRPGIEDDIESDLDMLFNIAQLIERHVPESRLYDPLGIVAEFAKSIRKELDFMVEARNAEKFKRNFEGVSNILIPAVYWEATGKRILTLEKVHGTRISDIGPETDEKERRTLAENIAKAYMKQILADGFFHADPHSGNIFVVDGKVVAFMDFGIMGRIDDYMKEKLASLFIAVLQKNKEKIVDEFLDIGIVGDETSIAEFRSDIGELIDEYYGTSLREVEVSVMLNQVMRTALRHRIRIPANFALLIKTLVTVESICVELSDDFNFTQIAKPFVESMVAERIHPARLMNRFIENVLELNEMARILPRKLDKVLTKLQEGKLVIDLEHKGLNRLITRIDDSSSRLSTSLVISSIIVGSSVIMLTGKGPLLYGFPAPGVVGFVAAGVLGLLLVFSTLRSGRL
ncbi:MAG: AarF/ABC1/UbiB kinase family protein [Candidatus Altiarchaeota archaeon]|nr:AarF/ABC1/UbiB kinase family protein [Candidatus Altiarchaeota archaeon]